MGRLGAFEFWRRFHEEPTFRDRMREAWRGQRYDRDQKKKAARKGAAALWHRYHTDPTFKTSIDLKLKASRSRGGAKSSLSIGESAFRHRLTASASSRNRPTYHDSEGNQLRSRLELRFAEALRSRGISYTVEPRLDVPGHAFYPDFVLAKGHRIIEVVGYAADWYWDKTAAKIKLITENHPTAQVAVVTPFRRMMAWRLQGVPRTTLFTPYQLEPVMRWCRGMPGFTTSDRGQSG